MTLLKLFRRWCYIQYRKRIPIDTRWGMALAIGFKPSLRESIRYRRLVLRAAKQTANGYRECLYSVDGSIDKVFVDGVEKPKRVAGRQL